METFILIILISFFIGVTATAQESLLEKREKVRQEKLMVRKKFQEQSDKEREARIEAIEEKKRKKLLKIKKEEEEYEQRNKNIN
jgi:hypothetical protein